MPYCSDNSTERLYPFFFLKSEFKYAMPYSSARASPISLSFSAFFNGLMDKVVVK